MTSPKNMICLWYERDAEAASKLERSEEAAALPDDEAMASSI